MNGNHFSLILLSTNRCNADCDYCFEDKTRDRLTHEKLDLIMDKVLAYMDEQHIGSLTLHWQGGEAMLLPPHWYEEAYQRIGDAAARRGKTVSHGLQTNMLLYSPKWKNIIREMFGNSISTSVDYPNQYRRLRGQSPDNYNTIWARRVKMARADGIDIKAISVLNQGTLDIGAERYYEHMVDELGVTDFQINTPFPGGAGNDVKDSLPLAVDDMARFHCDLADVWLERGYYDGVRVGPFDELLNVFTHRDACLPCIWGQNCADEILSIDARGFVAQCDCWVTSYPEYFFGNIFDCDSFGELLATSKPRKDFYERPVRLMEKDCISCDFLSMCHGGCPVRTYTVEKTMFEKDPYCGLYKAMFAHMRDAATRLTRHAVPAMPIAETRLAVPAPG
jgi:radical SAM protein with 4Fe4S-binding SPASM domain